MAIIAVKTMTIEAMRAVPKRTLIEYSAAACNAKDVSPYGPFTN